MAHVVEGRWRLAVAAGLAVLAVGLGVVWLMHGRDPAPVDPEPRAKSGTALFPAELLQPTDWHEMAGADHARETRVPAAAAGQREVYRGFYRDGAPCYEYRTVNGLQDGPDVMWAAGGQQVQERHWQAGKLHGRCRRWYANGQLAEEAVFDQGRYSGTYRAWRRDGKPSMRCDFADGIRSGLFEAWHPNGTKLVEANYRAGRLHGPWQKWDAAGTLVKRLDYRDGRAQPSASGTGKATPRRPAPADASFALVFAQGQALFGYDVLRVSAGGSCECRYFIYPAAGEPTIHNGRGDLGKPVWLSAQFHLGDDVQRKLREAVEEADPLTLDAHYVKPHMADSGGWVVGCRLRGTAKWVDCVNDHPVRLERLARRLAAEVIAVHRAELLTGTPVEAGISDPKGLGWLMDTAEAGRGDGQR